LGSREGREVTEEGANPLFALRHSAVKSKEKILLNGGYAETPEKHSRPYQLLRTLRVKVLAFLIDYRYY
jgi:hypothetical protein